jgi:outer membrane receptor protein involved in Fe transport
MIQRTTHQSAGAKHKQVLHLSVLTAMIGAAFPLHAQHSAVASGAAAPLRVEVTGAYAAYDARREDTASKIVVSHDEIMKYGDTSIVDALKRVPGVTVNGSDVRMRGLGNGYTQILIDGDRAPAGFSIDSLSPDVIERIEVLRTATAEFSTQSIAGTINIVLKQAVKKEQRTLKAGYLHGASVNGPDASLQMSDKRGQLSYSLAVSVNRVHSSQHPHTVDQQFDSGDRLVGMRVSDGNKTGRNTAISVLPRVTWSIDNDDTLTSQTFLNFYQYNHAATESVRTALGPPPAYPLMDRGDGTIFRIVREELNWVHKFGDGVKLDARLSGMYNHVTHETHRTGTGNVMVADLHESLPAYGADHGVSTMGKFSSAVGDNHTLVMGWDAGRTARDATRLDRDSLQPDVLLDEDQRYGTEISRLALFVQDEFKITPSWSTYLGVRWEGMLIRTYGNVFPVAHSRSDVFSPVVQTLYKLPNAPGDQLRFAVSRTYKAPDLMVLIPMRFKSGNNTQITPDQIGNPRLRPELAFGFDAGYEHYGPQGTLLSASISERRISDYMRNALRFADERWTSMPENLGHAHTYGLELEAKLPLKALVSTAHAIDLRASLSRNWSRVDAVPGPHNRLDSQTPLSATLGADYKQGSLTLGSSFVWKNGGQARLLPTQTIYQSVQRDLDAYATWQFDPMLQLRISATGLLAQPAYTASDFVFPDGGRQSTNTLTPSYRKLHASLQMKF